MKINVKKISFLFVLFLLEMNFIFAANCDEIWNNNSTSRCEDFAKSTSIIHERPENGTEQYGYQRLVNHWFLGGILRSKHMSRAIYICNEDFQKLKNQHKLTPIQQRAFEDNKDATTGNTYIIISFFESRESHNGRRILELRYNDPTDTFFDENDNQQVGRIGVIIPDKILDLNSKEKSSISGTEKNEMKFEMAVKVLEALSHYEDNQVNVRYSASFVNHSKGNCNVGQGTLNEATGGVMIGRRPFGLINFSKRFALKHFENQSNKN